MPHDKNWRAAHYEFMKKIMETSGFNADLPTWSVWVHSQVIRPIKGQDIILKRLFKHLHSCISSLLLSYTHICIYKMISYVWDLYLHTCDKSCLRASSHKVFCKSCRVSSGIKSCTCVRLSYKSNEEDAKNLCDAKLGLYVSLQK